MYNLIMSPEKRVFRKTGEKAIYGWIIEYLENQYGLDYFKKGNVYDFNLIKEKIFEKFEFEVTGVFWGDKALRKAETEQIAIGKIGSNIQEVKEWLLRKGFTLQHDDPRIQEIIRKYNLASNVIGKALNDPIAAGIGGSYVKEFIWWCAYYTALGYSHSQMYDVTRRYHGYTKSLPSFKNAYQFILGSIVEARKILVDPIRQELRNEGFTDRDIDQLYPLSREFDVEEFLDLTVTGLSKRDIAQKLGFEEGHVGRIAKKIIAERYPYIPIYKYSSTTLDIGKKIEPSFEDLQYHLMGELILGYIFQGMNRKDIPNMFKSPINPTGIGPDMVDAICKRVLGGSFTMLQDEAREILLTIITLDINPRHVSDILTDSRNWMPKGTIGQKINQFFKDNTYVQMALKRGVLSKPTDIIKIALTGPHLERFYKLGMQDNEILKRLGSAYEYSDLRTLTDYIWGITPDEARRVFFTRFLGE